MDGNPWLSALKPMSDFQEIRDYSQINFWNCHSSEGQGQVRSREYLYHFNASNTGLLSLVGNCDVLSKCGRSEIGTSRANGNSGKGPGTNPFSFRE